MDKTNPAQPNEKAEAPDAYREVCHSCFRPRALCYCALLQPVDNQTPLLIVQHPHERFHPFGTARIAERCLKDVRIEVDYDRVLRDGSRELQLPQGAALLFPGPEARDLASIPPESRPQALVVLDGTWHQARSLYRDIPTLHDLPKVMFNPDQPSQYRIRKEPSLECVSTIEAIVHSLKAIEPETPGFDEMLSAFHGMIDMQIAAAATYARKPRFPKRPRGRNHGLPDWFADEFDRIVIVHGEATFSGEVTTMGTSRMSSREKQHQPKVLIYWVAERLATGERFSSLIRPDVLPTEGHLCPTQITTEQLEAAPQIDEAKRAWHAFTNDADIVVSWNKSTLDVMRPLEHQGPTHFLKGTYKNFARRCDPECVLGGAMDAVIERESLGVKPATHYGRAGLRIAQLKAVAQYIRNRALTWPGTQSS
ncbi:MAG: DTW domain-containing protein YfiP [Myxococcota bacterium]|jgi:DTW domain-containing protein YfiP